MPARVPPAPPARTLRSADDVVVQVAWLYYHDGLNQTAIADYLGVSRASVVSWLQQARERGLVRIRLDDAAFAGHRLARALRERFGLAGAHVLPDAPDETAETVFLRVAHGAAAWLPALLVPGDRLGVSWGRTVFELAEAMEPTVIEGLTVTQLVGSMATPYGFTAEICSATVARRLSAACVNLHAPAVLSDASLAARLREEPIIRAQLDALARCNKAVFAAGSCTPESHIVGAGVATLDELRDYLRRGAVGVVCGRFVDARGREVPGSLAERIIGVELADLTGLETGLLVSTGAERVAPMLAAIRGGYVTHVVTSASTAEALLARADTEGA